MGQFVDVKLLNSQQVVCNIDNISLFDNGEKGIKYLRYAILIPGCSTSRVYNIDKSGYETIGQLLCSKEKNPRLISICINESITRHMEDMLKCCDDFKSDLSPVIKSCEEKLKIIDNFQDKHKFLSNVFVPTSFFTGCTCVESQMGTAPEEQAQLKKIYDKYENKFIAYLDSLSNTEITNLKIRLTAGNYTFYTYPVFGEDEPFHVFKMTTD